MPIDSRFLTLNRAFMFETITMGQLCISKSKHLKPKMRRWIEELVEYTFSIIHRPGTKHQNADSLGLIRVVMSLKAGRSGGNLKVLLNSAAMAGNSITLEGLHWNQNL